MNKYITTSDGKISVCRDEFLGHQVFENPLGDYILIRTISSPGGRCVNYGDKAAMFKAGKEIVEQLSI